MKWYAQKGIQKRSAAEARRAWVWDRWGESLPHDGDRQPAESSRELGARDH